MQIHFTFYGDLLGMAAAYRLSPDVAYKKLNDFYNTVFNRFEGLCNNVGRSVQVYMFSDSVLIWGKEAITTILDRLQDVYLDLIRKDLLLRGALVQKALQREPRLEVANFRKFCPPMIPWPALLGWPVGERSPFVDRVSACA